MFLKLGKSRIHCPVEGESQPIHGMPTKRCFPVKCLKSTHGWYSGLILQRFADLHPTSSALAPCPPRRVGRRLKWQLGWHSRESCWGKKCLACGSVCTSEGLTGWGCWGCGGFLYVKWGTPKPSVWISKLTIFGGSHNLNSLHLGWVHWLVEVKTS